MSPHVRLVALHILAVIIKHLNSAQLLAELPTMIPSILPSFGSSLVDLRKAIVFVLVEIYLVVGDALHDFVSDLSPPQKKLLTIYIERQLNVSVSLN
jgi:CLIP-associating protein 1/2